MSQLGIECCDSDSDWDDDDDFTSKKINIKIKPIGQMTPSKISASVDELRATVGTWKSLASINLVKPNSRRSHLSASLLIPIPPTPAAELPNSTNSNQNHLKTNASTTTTQQLQTSSQQYSTTPPPALASNGASVQKFPVAFAIQECLNTRLCKRPDGSVACIARLLGRLKIATPNYVDHVKFQPVPQSDLEITLQSELPWNDFRLNHKFISTSESLADQNHLEQQASPSIAAKRYTVSMKSLQDYVEKQYQIQPSVKYCVLPDLLEYSIGELVEVNNQVDTRDMSTSETSVLNPLDVQMHWLCDLVVTKVRVDINYMQSNLEKFNLTTDDIKNLKISLDITGGVESYQSKPEANWNHLNSTLTWSFKDLTELVQKSSSNGITSCLARFNLNDGPSTQNDVNLQFSICDRTISGTTVSLSNSDIFKVAALKSEVRTGIFRCEARCS